MLLFRLKSVTYTGNELAGYDYLQSSHISCKFSPTKENRVHQTNISMKTDKGGFSPAVIRSRLEQKNPVTECQVHCVCVFFCGEIYGNGPNILLRAKCSEGSLGRCSRVSNLLSPP